MADHNRYSVDARAAGRMVLVRSHAERIVVLLGDEIAPREIDPNARPHGLRGAEEPQAGGGLSRRDRPAPFTPWEPCACIILSEGDSPWQHCASD
jgi:hypothetical protein